MRKTIRNFSIIAHIDHGKSTLADRLLEYTGALSSREMMAQVLDSMDLERERGITIKAHAVRLNYLAADGKQYILNLIDTPGHVDFSYEVSRSLASCEGALLIVDATQGVEAQTVANTYLAMEHNLEIIPVINKIDLPASEPDRVKVQIEEIVGIDSSEAILASAKEGIGTKEILETIVRKIPPPGGDAANPLKALLFDSWFDNYQGVIVLVRIFDGKVKAGMKVRLMSTGKDFEVSQVGVFTPKMETAEMLSAGEVGYIIAGIKSVSDTQIGDTITDTENPTKEPCPGYKEIKPMVFSGLYPTETHQYTGLKDALDKLRLNDASFSFEPETSSALGFGFRCGFLGLLHMEIIRERLEREFGLSLISTAPTVVYRVTDMKGNVIFVDNPTTLPERFLMVEEPFVKITIFVPQSYIGSILDLCQEKRGVQKDFTYIGKDRIMVIYDIPLNEILWDFYDRLKSLSKGYASMDYEFTGYREADLIRLDILLNGEPVDALSLIVHRDKAYYKGRQIAEKLREVIPRQLYEVVIQAAAGSKIIARESVKALRKDVLAKCYGGDITRKRKLLEKQKEGKKRMKQVGRIEVPQEAFLSVLKVK
ncbi:MAG TPA: elongation factor 4 [Nitrospiraceae bacterium]|jgi:GTP-binding protein LepA|nr:elongation factor 4 [Nitrospiraceae bacterium]